jgi:hypothetical protein
MDETMRRLFEATMVRLRPFGISGILERNDDLGAWYMKFRTRPVDRTDQQYACQIGITEIDLRYYRIDTIDFLPDRWFREVTAGIMKAAVEQHAKTQEVPADAQPR